MARMAIDDSALRDPRMLRLAKRLGWSRRETIGALLDVWAISYDQATAVLAPEDIDTAADLEGFHAELIGVGLAEHTDLGVLIRGAAKRIRYLEDSEESGRRGGLKSGEVRAAKGKATNDQGRVGERVTGRVGENPSKGRASQPSNVGQLTLGEGLANLPDPVPDPVPDLAPDPVPDPDRITRAVSGSDEQDALESSEHGKSAPRASHAHVEGVKQPPADAVALAEMLQGFILDNHPGNRMHRWTDKQREVTRERWAQTIDRMHRIDHLAWHEIQGMITWCQRDQFWRGVILGAENLREKWDTMTAQRTRPPRNGAHAARKDPTALCLEELAEIEARERAAKEQAG